MSGFDQAAGRISHVIHEGSALVVLAGELDAFDAPTFCAVRDELLLDRPRNLSIDTRAVTFVDCAFLGALVDFVAACPSLGIRCSMIEPSAAVRRLSTMLQLDRFLHAPPPAGVPAPTLPGQ